LLKDERQDLPAQPFDARLRAETDSPAASQRHPSRNGHKTRRMTPIWQRFRHSNPDSWRIRDEANAKINESLAECLDLGIFGAKRGVSGNRQPEGLKTWHRRSDRASGADRLQAYRLRAAWAAA
jgi:hypothetical protein